ncbi:MAG: MEDS domain-containing protein [Pseudonocardiaceae bacterium]
MIENVDSVARRSDPGGSGSSASKVRSVKQRIKGHVVLDKTWARRLGVRRSGGRYRITRRELMERLQQLQQTPTQRVLNPPAVANHRALTSTEPSPANMAALGHSHFVGFYETEAFLADSVRNFLAAGLANGDVAIVVATDVHRRSFDRALMKTGIDLPEAYRYGRLIALDASETLAEFMVDGTPDAARFSTAIRQLVFRAAGRGRGVRIYGEMVTVLWDEGNVAGAIALEELWNELAIENPISLFCAYPMRAFDTKASTAEFRRICGQHSRALLEN